MNMFIDFLIEKLEEIKKNPMGEPDFPNGDSTSIVNFNEGVKKSQDLLLKYKE